LGCRSSSGIVKSSGIVALSKLGEQVNGGYRIISQPPLIVPARELAATYGMSPDELMATLHDQLRAYRATLPDDRRKLLERYQIVDAARKVVGVGSVGTRCYIVLLEGRDAGDPLFLQIKEAVASVYEGYLPKSRYRQHGERVVQGQLMMQASSDIYLGWVKGVQANRAYYWRQLRDMKGSAVIEAMSPLALTYYAGLCGWALARAHARSGDPVSIAAYLDGTDAFDKSITDFAQRYADQNEQDHDASVAACGAASGNRVRLNATGLADDLGVLGLGGSSAITRPHGRGTWPSELTPSDACASDLGFTSFWAMPWRPARGRIDTGNEAQSGTRRVRDENRVDRNESKRSETKCMA
jgi:hypothetical protein